LADPLPIEGPVRRFRAMVKPPGSKSLSNRLFVLAGLARGRSLIRRPLLGADDTERMLGALSALGAEVERVEGGHVAVQGVEGTWKVEGGVRLDLGNAGTAVRFLTAAALLADGPVTIDGNARMRQRPIGELVEAMRWMSGEVEYLDRAGRLPLMVEPLADRESSRALRIPTTMSSQYISALLMVGSWLEHGLTIKLVGEITSRSYIAMTVGLLDQLGACVRTSDDLRVMRVGPALNERGEHGPPGIGPFDIEVEADASGATYFWGAAALVDGATCRVEGIRSDSLQGDVGLCDILRRMGATIERAGAKEAWIECRGTGRLTPVMADMSDMPDAAVTLAVVAAFANGRSILRGLKTLRVKECDRLAALRTELAKIGVEVETDVMGDAGAMTISPPAGGVDCSSRAAPVVFDTYDDHRMAMALSLVGLRRPGVSIKDPGCVGKTYPGFWEDFGRLVGES
jgi:3-phosphoshikimate 1-carboxyvinyltransferase